MNTKVLISGAGPTGLMMACQLQRFGIDFIIVDRKNGISEQSKALAVQSRSLEIYQQMDISDTAIEEGQKASAVNLVVKGEKIARIILGDIGSDLSPFPFMHILGQDKNEAILEKFIIEHGDKVLWNNELIDFTDDGKKVTTKLKDINGNETIITSDWLMAADGGKSPIRHKLHIPFEGDTYGNTFFVADTQIDWAFDYDELYVSLSKKTLNAFFPMKGENKFRIVGMLPAQFHDRNDLTFDDIKESIKENIDFKLDFQETYWFAIYKLHHRCVDNFRKGRCFFAGDAAHIHSPAGGQGMNTGLQDAYNLAWKLSLVIKNQAKESLLDTYNEERLPNARILVNTTDNVFSMGISQNPFIKFFRLNILPIIAKTAIKKYDVRKFIYKTISQIRINYIGSSVSEGNLNNLKAGMRFPYFELYNSENGQKYNVYDLFKTNKISVIIFSDNNSKRSEMYQEIHNHLREYKAEFLIVEVESNSENVEIFTKMGFGNHFVCVVRPDNYIGYIDNDLNIIKLGNYLTKNLRLNLSE